LGIFIVAFFIKVIKGSTVFFAAIASQAVVLIGYFYILDSISYLLFNVIGCALVILFSFILFPFLKNR